MATYKLIQDIEAEDHILGPLTLRQFIFALITAFLLYIDFLVVVKGAAFLLIMFLPPTLLVGFFAAPIGGDQPTEVWALAKLRFYFKPRQRLWNQSGVKELVTITVPKKIERVYTDGLSQGEVKSRLKALANTIDTRGWAIKNVDVDTYRNPLEQHDSDRLFDLSSFPEPVAEDGMTPGDDMLDEANSPVAQQLNAMMDQSAQAHRQSLVTQMNAPAPAPAATPAPAQPAADQPAADYWFVDSSPAAPAVQPQPTPAVAAEPTPEELAVAARAKQQASSNSAAYGHMHTLQPTGSQPAAPVPAKPQPAADPAILSLANNNDLNVATLAHEAKKAKSDNSDDDEVVIALR